MGEPTDRNFGALPHSIAVALVLGLWGGGEIGG
jgi:hypothetical protein